MIRQVKQNHITAMSAKIGISSQAQHKNKFKLSFTDTPVYHK
jgi:hypothetical protein